MLIAEIGSPDSKDIWQLFNWKLLHQHYLKLSLYSVNFISSIRTQYISGNLIEHFLLAPFELNYKMSSFWRKL
jgi:hypothetical protein